MRIITNNWRIKLAAVFIAASTWGVVAYASNPVNSHEYPHVNLQTGPPPNSNWVVVSPVSQVSVTLSGLQQSLTAYDQKNLKASVDLGQARVGINHVRVQVDAGDPAVTVTRVVPQTVAVVLDEKEVTTKKVEIHRKGSPNSCCAAPPDGAAVNPDSVRLSGPRSLLARITPYVEVELAEARTTIKLDQAAVKLDAAGATIGNLVMVEPAAVAVTVPITVVHKSVQAFVRVVDQGQVAPLRLMVS
ncbi:MAG: YbbR-like domain-containing protein, partial [Candidatus Dormibacteria bacterium]